MARRNDGLCPRCGINTRTVRESGVKSRDSYYPECRRVYDATHFSAARYVTVPVCTSCGIEPRYVTPSGKVYAYCVACKRKRNKASLMRSALRKVRYDK